MQGTLTMSHKERERLKVISRIEPRQRRGSLASESLGISERQLYRSVKRFRSEGDQGLIHPALRDEDEPPIEGYLLRSASTLSVSTGNDMRITVQHSLSRLGGIDRP